MVKIPEASAVLGWLVPAWHAQDVVFRDERAVAQRPEATSMRP